MNVLNEVNYKILSVVGELIVDDPIKRDMLARVKKDGYALKHASDGLKGDREIVLAAVMQKGYTLRYASEELRGDREIVNAAVIQTGWALKHASVELRGDREIVLVAVSRDGEALAYASDEMTGDQEIVLAAVSNNADVLQYASDALKNSGLKSYVERLINQYNVTKDTFIATILFGARQTSQGDDQEGIDLDSLPSRLGDHSESALRLLGPSSEEGDDFSTYAKRLIWDYAGVRSGKRWRVIESAAGNLGIKIPG